MGQLLNGQLAELPAILDSLFSGLVNTTSTSIRVECGGWWGSHKLAGSSDFKSELSQIVSIEALLSSTYVSQSVAKSMANVTSQSCGDLQPAVCLSRQDGAI